VTPEVTEFEDNLGATWGSHDPDEPLARLLRDGVRGDELMLIDGALVPSSAGRVFENTNPATGQALGVAADASPEDIDAAITAARLAFGESAWAADPELRRRCLLQLHDAMARNADLFRALAVLEVGIAARTTYLYHSDAPIAALPYWAEMAARYEYETELPDQPWSAGTKRIIRREPTGVVAAICPWNFPLYTTMTKLAPALAAGCTVILKPAPQSPWYGTLLARLIAEETDIPRGVVNVVTTSDNSVAERLTTDPRVDLVHFTGSTDVGKRIMSNAGAHIGRVALELGGKSANIVLPDMPMERVVPYAAGLVCINSGQGCVLPTRLLIPETHYAEAVELATFAYQNIMVGDPREASTFQGPQVSAAQRDRVMAYIEAGKESGATLACGGGRPSGLDKGFFVEPTLFTDVDPASRIAQEEIFGPVLAMIPYRDVDDAVRIANCSKYGLAGAVWSTDTGAAVDVARRVRTGMLSVNGGNFYAPDVPAGGFKQSGIGRESGDEGFAAFFETKTIAVGNES
jgi:aldehyde dehydrogenase (NAD+)